MHTQTINSIKILFAIADSGWIALFITCIVRPQAAWIAFSTTHSKPQIRGCGTMAKCVEASGRSMAERSCPHHLQFILHATIICMLTACHHFTVVAWDLTLVSCPSHNLELMSASRRNVEILVGMMTNSLSRNYGTRPRSSCSFLLVSRPDAATKR
jgi:hypothetical protein